MNWSKFHSSKDNKKWSTGLKTLSMKDEIVNHMRKIKWLYIEEKVLAMEVRKEEQREVP